MHIKLHQVTISQRRVKKIFDQVELFLNVEGINSFGLCQDSSGLCI